MTATTDGHHDHHHHGVVRIPAAGSDAERARQNRVLWLALAVNGVLLVAEVVGGVVFGSLALLADAAHMLSDVAGLGIALVAQSLMARASSPRHTFGMLRAEAMGAQANAVLLLASTGWILVEAFRRAGQQVEIEGGGLLTVATLGLLVNVVSAIALARVRGDNLNVEGAYAHMVADALGSVGAIAAGVAVVLWDATWFDTVASVLIALLVVRSGWRLLRATTQVLMEGAPTGTDAAAVEQDILAVAGVTEVHHLHLWSLSSSVTALSAHVVLDGDLDLHGAQEHGDRVRTMLRDDHGIGHATLELECHPCAPDDTHP